MQINTVSIIVYNKLNSATNTIIRFNLSNGTNYNIDISEEYRNHTDIVHDLRAVADAIEELAKDEN